MCHASQHGTNISLIWKNSKTWHEGQSEPKEEGYGWWNWQPGEKETGTVNCRWFPQCFCRRVSTKGRAFSWYWFDCEIKHNA